MTLPRSAPILFPLPLLLVPFLFSFLAGDARGEVICLRDGTCLSGAAPTPLGDRFLRLETLKGVVEIDREEILFRREDEELRDLFDAARAGVEPGNVAELCRLAWWCRRKGLYEEMFSLLDAVEAADPGNEKVAAFVGEMAASIDYHAFGARGPWTEKRIKDLFRASLSSGPTLARIGEKILSHVPREILTPFLLKSLKSRRKNETMEALRILKTFRPEEALAPLIAAALFSSDGEVRRLSLDVLDLYEDERIVYPFAAALRLKRRAFRMNAMDGLARLGDARVSGSLIANLAPSRRTRGEKSGATRASIYVGTQTAAITGFNAQVAAAAAAAAPIVSILKEGATLDVKVFGTAAYGVDAAERWKIGRLLKDFNGVDCGTDFALWKEWWDRNKERILAPAESTPQ